MKSASPSPASARWSIASLKPPSIHSCNHMPLHGKSLIAGVLGEKSARTFHADQPARQPAARARLSRGPARRCRRARWSWPSEAFAPLRAAGGRSARAAFSKRSPRKSSRSAMRCSSARIARSGLPLDRLTGERGRTVGQLRLFAQVVREGSWCDARIDTALPDRSRFRGPICAGCSCRSGR